MYAKNSTRKRSCCSDAMRFDGSIRVTISLKRKILPSVALIFARLMARLELKALLILILAIIFRKSIPEMVKSCANCASPSR